MDIEETVIYCVDLFGFFNFCLLPFFSIMEEDMYNDFASFLMKKVLSVYMLLNVKAFLSSHTEPSNIYNTVATICFKDYLLWHISC